MLEVFSCLSDDNVMELIIFSLESLFVYTMRWKPFFFSITILLCPPTLFVVDKRETRQEREKFYLKIVA